MEGGGGTGVGVRPGVPRTLLLLAPAAAAHSLGQTVGQCLA